MSLINIYKYREAVVNFSFRMSSYKIFLIFNIFFSCNYFSVLSLEITILKKMSIFSWKFSGKRGKVGQKYFLPRLYISNIHQLVFLTCLKDFHCFCHYWPWDESNKLTFFQANLTSSHEHYLRYPEWAFFSYVSLRIS